MKRRTTKKRPELTPPTQAPLFMLFSGSPPESRAKYLANDSLAILRDMERHVVDVEHTVRRAGITLEFTETYTTKTPRNHIQHLRIVNDFISHLTGRLRRATEALSTLI